MTDSTPPLTFEQALTQLEQIVTELERGETPLEETIARFEQGVSLARRCEDRLNEAERKVAVLLQEGGRVVEKDLKTGEQLSARAAPAAAPAPARFSAPDERFDLPLPPEPPPQPPPVPVRTARPGPVLPAPPAVASAPPAVGPAAPQGQMSLSSAFAIKPPHEMDDDDIPF